MVGVAVMKVVGSDQELGLLKGVKFVKLLES